jgi:hypothetical protein
VHVAIRRRLLRQQANSDPAPNRFSLFHQFLRLQHAIYSLEPIRFRVLQWNREVLFADKREAGLHVKLPVRIQIVLARVHRQIVQKSGDLAIPQR